jgi:hypothetical protein
MGSIKAMSRMEQTAHAVHSIKAMTRSKHDDELVAAFGNKGKPYKLNEVAHIDLPDMSSHFIQALPMTNTAAKVHTDNFNIFDDKPLVVDTPFTATESFSFGAQKQSTLTQLISMAIAERVKESSPEMKPALAPDPAMLPLAPHPEMLPRSLSLAMHCNIGSSRSPNQEQQVHEIPSPKSPPSQKTPSSTTNKMLLVYKLPRCANEHQVRAVFESFGNVTLTSIIRDPNGSSKCFGFVHFSTLQAAQQAVVHCELGHVVLKDENGKTWHIKAECAKDGPHKRTKRGGLKHNSGKKSSPNSASSGSSDIVSQ